MATLDTDVDLLEQAMRELFQALKRPQRWARITAAAGVQLDRPAAAILQILHFKGDGKASCNVHELAQHLQIEAPSVTRKTQELEKQGFLERVQNSADRRSVDLIITDKGIAAAEQLWQIQREFMVTALRSWPAKERSEFVRLFSQFASGIAQPTDSLIKN